MARRAGVVPFSLSSVTLDAPSAGHVRQSPTRGHANSHSSSSAPTLGGSGPSPRYHREGPATRSIAARRESMPRSALPNSPSESYMYGGMGPGHGMGMGIPLTGPPPMLPSVAEMTTGVSPYNTPAYSISVSMAGGQHGSSPTPILPSIGYPPPRHLPGTSEGKRRGSPDVDYRETTRRRQDR